MTSVKQLAKRKLKEFHRWCRVAVLHHDMIQVDENWTIKLFEFDPEDYKGKVHGWQREAPNEVNEILKAINAIAKPRHRAILIMSYISPDKLRSVEQAKRLRIAESTYYLAKNEALLEFAGQYRSGELLQHLDS
ncbi:ArpU family phage packaging/lysis transcriptional regulator [Streptococcus suis]|uniref:ArpU family phage packaging/lysis transcriptional regulator n=1 Tax=Streptococcus suis TaxID=1307 RepID=UPI00129051C2|nr:ArpU family phage packaging/lysis transcriptional regulator [Streptococcus suis]